MTQATDTGSLQWATWLDSMEGIPEWPQPAESPREQAARGTWAGRAHEVFGWAGTVLPGLGLALILAAAGRLGAEWLGKSVMGFTESPVSEITVAVVLGLLIRNTIGLPAVYERGLRLCGREVLRIGIVLIGLRLSLDKVGWFGLVALPVIAGCIVTALVTVGWINRALGLPRRLGSLIAVGTSICGVSAIAATAPVIDAEEDEVSYAVACVTLFGLVALFTYPFAANALFADPVLAGRFLGVSIHDTAQVAGAGLMYRELFQAPAALDAATVTKLTRNLCMIGVIPLVGALYHRSAGERTAAGRVRLGQMVPLFVFGFLAAAAVSSAGDLGVRHGRLDPAAWKQFLDGGKAAAGWCLTVAMASVGLGTSLARVKRLGWKSFGVGLAAAAVVGGVSATLIGLLGAYL